MANYGSKKSLKSKAKISRIALIPFAVLISVLVLYRSIPPNFTSEESLFVKKVFDGDSILLLDGREIRYIGIDAPETFGKRPQEYYGREARELNESLVLGKEVRLEFDVEKKDSYNRTLAYVYLEDVMINLKMVEAGCALAVPYPPNLRYQEELCGAMLRAKEEKIGIWEDPDVWMIKQEEASRHIGLSKTVVGRVIYSDTNSAGTFLNFGEDFSLDFTVFIPKEYHKLFYDQSILDPAGKYLGRMVEITGTLREKNGPSITVRHPCQIFVSE